MNFELVDWIFCGIILVCAILAMIKGFIAEILNKAAWVLGGLAGLLFADKVNVYLAPKIQISWLSIILSFLLIFIVVFLIIMIIKVILKKIFEGEILGPLNRALGFFLGVAEGLVLVMGLIFLICKVPFLNIDVLHRGVFYSVVSPWYNSEAIESETDDKTKENSDSVAIIDSTLIYNETGNILYV